MEVITQRFLAAVRICSGELTIKERLVLAWTAHLDDLEPGQLPLAQQGKFESLRKAMYERSPLPSETAPQASIRKMSAKQARKYTALILAIYAELVRETSRTAFDSQEQDNRITGDSVNGINSDIGQRLN